MSFASVIHDPLAINLRRQTSLALKLIPPTSRYHGALVNASTTRQLLAALSSVLAAPAFTQAIATFFRPILVDLCARWLESSDDTELHLIALCYLVEVHEELFPILNQLLSNHFEGGPLSFVAASPSLLSTDFKRLHQILLAYYRILQANRELPKHLLWPLAPLSKIMWTAQLDNGVKLLAIRCYSLQSGMAEAERLKIEREVLGEPCGVDCQLNYGQNLDGTEKEVDGWVMPVVELKRVREEREQIATQPLDCYSRDETDSYPPIHDTDICSHIANVYGVLLLRSSTTPSHESSLIPTPSSIHALRQISLNISLRLPILLSSAPSTGKALLISHLASLLHPGKRNQVVTVHLADTSLDARALLGSYVSSSVHSGTFEWKEGVLVRSMQEGKWVVFEDIDRGSNEVLGLIKPLVESLELGKWIGGRARIDVPGQGPVIAHDQFMLFATRSTNPSRNGNFHPPTFFGSHKFSEVIVPSLSTEELSLIVDAKFPRLAGSAAQKIIGMWDAVRQLGSPASSRDVGLRELQKFCQRIESLLPTSHQAMNVALEGDHMLTLSDIFPNPSLREEMYLEARDIFFGAGTLTAAARAHSKTIAELIGKFLGLKLEHQLWVLQGKSPEFAVEKDSNGRRVAVRLGRTCLPAQSNQVEVFSTPTRPFAMHKLAVSLMSRIANAVSHGEPILLTGETGTGKTSVITHLASLLNRPLISLNLSHQTESSDLIGGLKPIDARIPGFKLQETFFDLFGVTFSRKKNEKFATEVRKAVNECKWKRAVGLWKESVRLATERLQTQQPDDDGGRLLDEETPRKRRKTELAERKSSVSSWSTFLHQVEEFEVQHVHGKSKFSFGFVEGPLVKALRSGDWVLLDEINLASPETLECISGLLQGPTASITLTEHGSLEPVPRHSNFRLFACMNPATDVGKKDLPATIRSRFTEIDVLPPDADREMLLDIITQYIGHVAVGDKRIIMDIAEFYTAVKEVADRRQIADGANHRPHFSMRTLTRALTFAAEIAPAYTLRRSVWEGCLMGFTMVLDSESATIVTNLARKHLLAKVSNPRSVLAKEPPAPTQGSFVKFGPFYLEKGPLEEDLAEDYVMTSSVEQKLIDLARIVLTRRFPVLIEGPTSSGKTSSIEYLAKRTGHRFIRINNHEHTDIQEYLGSYVSDPASGKLVFKYGLLVQALRHGHWIVLDELNLAPTDVLEALNRLLDDNRELVIPETQEVVRPHPHFMLFATQNPPGLYAGRKVLSRAFRNRFLEVHFEDVPQSELEMILCQKCQIAPPYGKKIVSVFHELQNRRQTSRVFESKHSFATLRDLFRWAGRDAVGYQELANNGYMLLAERARRPEDKLVVKEVIELIMGVRIDEDAMYNLQRKDADISSFLGHAIPSSSNTIWTKAMQRLYVLVCRALKFNEPVLLVGETGSGKTSVCQIFADASSQRLLTLNCHQNSETADLIGGLRPVRNRSALQANFIQDAILALKQAGVDDFTPTIDGLTYALSAALKGGVFDHVARLGLEDIQRQLLKLNSIFEWHDGPLIEAMHNGDVFLLDEISLADDSVLERLNSVLEPGRSIVLAERGGTDSENSSIHADNNFKLAATMNPGGDYGKKELSPALRNRFTEIWVPQVDDRSDLELIISSSWKHAILRSYTSALLDFVEWLCARVGDRSLLTLRDILAWICFVNSAFNPDDENKILPDELFHHAAHMTYLDGMSSFTQLAGYPRETLQQLRSDALRKLQDLVPLVEPLGAAIPAYDPVKFAQLGSFAIPRGSRHPSHQSFNFGASTTLNNAMRVIRACQVPKPILLEGSPGVGKTSLVTALANISGHELYRVNLSDQTDLIDLFGSDLPIEGGAPGEFAWKDAEFLKALQEGHWVLLDEMNLAPQAVLEGLNAILDHRGTVYIPELNMSFECHPSFRIFAAQNPLHQGGGRKGLPKSFVNRFTKVYIEELSPGDLHTICSQLFPNLEANTLRAMISFNIQLSEMASVQRTFAQNGSPWEFNLRDVVRWGTLSSEFASTRRPEDFLKCVYLHRFRSTHDRQFARALFDKAFSTTSYEPVGSPPWTISADQLQFGLFTANRRKEGHLSRPRRILKMQLSSLETLGLCVSKSWLAILTGPKNSGKTSVVQSLASFTGNLLWEVPVNHATDTMDILGSFEQVDTRRRLITSLDETIHTLELDLSTVWGSQTSTKYQHQAYSLRKACEKATTLQVRGLLDTTFDLLSSLLESGTSFKQQYQTINAKLESLVRLSTVSNATHFEWVDGPLVKAMKCGQWILLDGANLCSPSVLDRLNSLCESDGFLTLSERGFVDGNVQLIKPHPHFRLFMSVDPHYGELSRAMRNRGIEIALEETPLSDDFGILCDHNRLPSTLSFVSSHIIYGVTFDAVRRGLANPESFKSPLPQSTGHSFDQDAALAHLVDQVPALFLDSPKVSNPASWVFFLACSLVPRYIRHVTRYLTLRHTGEPDFPALLKFLQTYPNQELDMALMVHRQTYALQMQVPISFIFTQPMNFFWREGLLSKNSVDRSNDFLPTHSLISEILNLCAAIFVSEQDAFVLDGIDEQRSLDEKNYSVRRAVISIVQEVQKSSLEVLGMITAIPSAIVPTRLTIMLLSFTTYLRRSLGLTLYDFSSLYAISKWFLDSLRDSSTLFDDILEHAKDLHRTVSPSTGLGLFAFWSTLFLDEPPTDLREAAIWTEKMASSLKASSNVSLLRRQAFSVISLETLTSQRQEPNLLELREILNRCLNTNVEDSGISDLTYVDPQSSTLELHILSLCNGHPDSQTVGMSMNEILTQASAEKRTSLLRLLPLQRLIWALDTGTAESRLFSRAEIGWLEGLWNAKLSSADISGPSILLHPIGLHSDVVTCDMDRVRLSSLVNHDASIRRQARMAIITSKQADRLTQLVCVFFVTVATVATVYSSSFDAATYEKIQHLTFEAGNDLPSSLFHALSLLENSSDDDFVTAVQQDILPLLSIPTSRTPMQLIGLAWIGISRVIMTLVIPDTPMDPAGVQNATKFRMEGEEIELTTQIRLHQQLERLITGNPENETLRQLGLQLAQIRSQLASSPHLPQRDDIPKIHLFWSEVLQFQKNVLPPTKVQSLVDGLLHADGEAFLREKVIQESLGGFCQRMDAAYPEFSDITVILKLAILHMRLGLRIVLESVSVADLDASPTKLASSLLSFPLFNCTHQINSSIKTIEPSRAKVFRPILLALASSSAELSMGIRNSGILSAVDVAYEQAMRLWLIDRAQEKLRDEEANTLYRRSHSEHHVISDAQLEEEEFLTMFPTFEDAFETAMPSVEKQQPSLVQPSDANTLLEIHLTIMDLHTTSRTHGDPSDTFQRLRRTAIEDLLGHTPGMLPAILDNTGAHFRFSLLRSALSSLANESGSTTSPYNFYVDVNYEELKKGATIIATLRQRLQIISDEWPDQMVLKNLLERCDAILNVGSKMSVAKILSMAEQLLIQTDDWEMYANRENTLKSHREELVRLVVDWRRLELSCWRTLLDSETISITDGFSDWWFRLYDAVLRGPLSSLDQGDGGHHVHTYINSLIPLLDDFIKTSPLGQFHARMQLIQSFERYITMTCPSRPAVQQSTLQRVSRVLNSTYSYYELFSDSLQKQLAAQKVSLEKEITAFIKLASWKDINIQALKASAKKTHHQLFKIIRKFREVLRQPVHERLRPHFAGDSEAHYLSMDKPEEAMRISDSSTQINLLSPDSFSLKGQSYLVNLLRTRQRFEALIMSQIRPFIDKSSAQTVDDAAVEIITTSKALATVVIPSTISSDLRGRHLKALLVRKRKAWADLLKELKHAGLPSNVKPDILRQNANEVWIREQPIMPKVSDLEIIKGEEYFLKLCGTLPLLRTSLPTHHSDLTTRELQRGELFLEATFSMAVDLRSRLASSLDILQRIRRTFQRLKSLAYEEDVVTPGSNVHSHLSSIVDILCKISHSLLEVQSNVADANQLGLEAPVSEGFMEEVFDVANVTEELHVQLFRLWEVINVSILPGLKTDEHSLVLRAEEHISHVYALLFKWQGQQPALDYLFSPLQRWLQGQTVTPLLPWKGTVRSDTSKLELLINSLLVCVQALTLRCPMDVGNDQEETEKYIVKGYQSIREFTHLLNLANINTQLDDLLLDLSSWSNFKEPLMKVLPFLDHYLSLVRSQLAAHSNWTKSLFKLSFVICSLLQTLCHQGFCKPPEAEESEAGGEASEVTGGVGIGDGSGTDNISKEIEDESQIEGLKGEEGEEKDQQGKHEDGDAIEISDDFGGALEDVSEAGSENDEESDGEQEPDIDETLGDLDNLDPSAVDEKMWGDKNGPEDSGKNEETTDQDRSKEQTGSSEVVAKETKEQKSLKETTEKRDSEKAEENEHDIEEMGQEEEATDPNVSGAPMEEHIPDGITLDLPDDMEIGGEDGEKEGVEDATEGDPKDGPEDGETDMAEKGSDEDGVDDVMNESNDESPLTNDPDGHSAEYDEQVNPHAGADEEKGEEEDSDEPTEDLVAQPDLQNGDGAMDAMEAANSNLESGESGTTGEAGISQSRIGEDSAVQEKTASNGGSMDMAQALDILPAESSSSGSGVSGVQQGQAPSQGESQPVPNPLRSLGDALKEVLQRFEGILNSNPQEVPRRQMGEPISQTQVEYLLPDDTDHEMQALGPAGEEQVAKLDQLNIIDDSMDVDDVPVALDVDIPLPQETHDSLPQHEQPPQGKQLGTEQLEDAEGAILRSSLYPTKVSEVGPGLQGNTREDNDMDDDNQDVELELRAWRSADYPENGAERIWRMYESLTHDLAYALCEQLRLILEPTLATRLKGDYRTGKRLNMKKVISYIASDFTKDKIWLRRTKPSQREYQVLIAIDDSRSMSESHSVHLAYQTLALISKALSRLESGDVAIAKFGETIDLLHGFDEGPFTDQAGTKVTNAFRFNQKATKVLALMEASLKILENARERKAMSSVSAAELWQLQIIVSDGMGMSLDEDKLRAILRKAEEQRVMVVFIILDSLQSGSPESGTPIHQSILSMDKAEFKNVDGKLELTVQKYLDTFPFDYYVVLRNVEALPEVLAGTLKQFFERISEE